MKYTLPIFTSGQSDTKERGRDLNTFKKNFPEFKEIVNYSKYMAKVSYIRYDLKLSKQRQEKKYGGLWVKIKSWL